MKDTEEDSPLDLAPDTFRELGHEAVEWIARELESLADDPARRWPTDEVRASLLDEPLPLAGLPPAAVLADFVERVGPYGMGNASPRFFAWVNSPAAPMGVLGDLLASAMNPSLAGGDHAPTYVEAVVLRWLRELVGWPARGGAVLTSGGSHATLLALAVMRHRASEGRDRAQGLAHEDRPWTLYASDETHSCVRKAVELLGLGGESLRTIASDDRQRIDLAALRRAIDADRTRGARPVALVGNAGTVNTGAVDPLDELADLAEAEGLWLHVDGAYGAAAALSEKLRPHLAGLERAHSLALDPHKWLYQPVDVGCVLVREAEWMRAAQSLVPPYLADAAPLPWFSESTNEQTRRFRALKLWFTLRHVGVRALAKSLERDVERVQELARRVDAAPDLERLSDGPLGVLCFRHRPADGRRDARLDDWNRALARRVQREGRVFLTTTELRGVTALRVCVVNFRTRAAHLEELLAAIERAARADDA